MSFNKFLNSTRSYDLHVRSEGLQHNVIKSRLWTAQRSLIRGLIMFVEQFCKRHNFSRVAIFKLLSGVFMNYAKEIESSNRQ